jgi:hypothetical protein
MFIKLFNNMGRQKKTKKKVLKKRKKLIAEKTKIWVGHKRTEPDYSRGDYGHVND